MGSVFSNENIGTTLYYTLLIIVGFGIIIWIITSFLNRYRPELDALIVKANNALDSVNALSNQAQTLNDTVTAAAQRAQATQQSLCNATASPANQNMLGIGPLIKSLNTFLIQNGACTA